MKKILILTIFLLIITTNAFSQEGSQKKQIPQPTFMIIPEKTEKLSPIERYMKDENAQAAANSLSTALNKRGIKPVNLNKAVENFEKLRAKKGSIDSDPTLSLATNLGADILLQFNNNIKKEGPTYQAVVKITIIEAVTGNEIGAITGYSKQLATNNYEALTQEAVDNAINDALQQVEKHWKKVPDYGYPVKIFITTDNLDFTEENADGDVYSDLIYAKVNELSISAKNIVTTDKNMVLVANIDIFKYPDPSLFGSEVRKFISSTLKFKAKSNSEGREIIIEVSPK